MLVERGHGFEFWRACILVWLVVLFFHSGCECDDPSGSECAETGVGLLDPCPSLTVSHTLALIRSTVL